MTSLCAEGAPLTTPLYLSLSQLASSLMFPIAKVLRTTFDHSSRSRWYPLRTFFSTAPARYTMTDTNQGGDASKKTYHKKATGNALTTVKSHSKEDDLKLYGSCFW